MRTRILLAAILLAASLGAYLANGRTMGSGDTLPARYLPFSIIGEGDFDLDEFPWLHDDRARHIFPTLERVPYYLRRRGEHVYSAYTPVPALVALPVYIVPVLAGLAPESPRLDLVEKAAASLIVALSALFLYLALLRRVPAGWAFALSLVYALGTSAWSVSSQALWQHGPSQLFLALVLFFLARAESAPRNLAVAALFLSCAVAARTTNIVFGPPLLAWAVARHRRAVPVAIAAFVPPLLLLVVHCLVVFGTVGPSFERSEMGLLSGFRQIPLLEGLFGALVGPARGLFVYSPVLLLVFPAIGLAARGRDWLTLAAAGGAALAIVLAAKWFMWWGGHCWGPRLLADIAPVLVFCLHPAASACSRRKWLAVPCGLLALFSIAAHGLGAFFHDGRWDALAQTDRRYESVIDAPAGGPIVFYAKDLLRRAGFEIPPDASSRHEAGRWPRLRAEDLPGAAVEPPEGGLDVRIEIAKDRIAPGERLSFLAEGTSPGRPRAFSVYFVLVEPTGQILFFDGDRLARTGDVGAAWPAWVSNSPTPYRYSSRLDVSLEGMPAGGYTLFVVFTDPACTKVVARAAAPFCVIPASLGEASAKSSDPFGMAARCPWYDPARLAMQWTFYLTTGENDLVYVGFAGRLPGPDGRPFAGVNLEVLEGNRKALGFWNRFPPEAVDVRATDLDVTLGPNRIRREGEGGLGRYSLHLELQNDGTPVVLDATVDQTVASCREGGFELLSHRPAGNYFEYEVPCPRGRLLGALRVGDTVRRLEGGGYVESIRWLSSALVKPAWWHWGYAYADPFTVLFFRPSEYPGARSLLTVSEGARCVAVVEGSEISVEPDAARPGWIRLGHRSDRIDLSLAVDASARRAPDFPIFRADYEIDIGIGGRRHQGSGRMVFEQGEWTAF